MEFFDFEAVEQGVEAFVSWVRLLIELLGVLIVALGVGVTLWRYGRDLLHEREKSFNETRITFGRYLALALEFQLAADILSTAIAPTWGAIGKLVVIVIVRTALNYFLMKEIEQERDRLQEDEGSDSEEVDKPSNRSNGERRPEHPAFETRENPKNKTAI